MSGAAWLWALDHLHCKRCLAHIWTSLLMDGQISRRLAATPGCESPSANRTRNAGNKKALTMELIRQPHSIMSFQHS